MPLGADQTVCRTELVEAMRTRLDTLTPPQGSNVDLPDVLANFDALGLGIWRIVTVRSEARSSAVEDPVFWAWVTQVNTWILAMAAWQAGVSAAFLAWAPTLPAEQALKVALAGVPAPGAPPAAPPASITGKVL